MSTVSIQPMTREMCHEFYKDFQNDPAIGHYYEYVYTPEIADRYFDTNAVPDRRMFAILVDGQIVGECKLKYIDLEKLECSNNLLPKHNFEFIIATSEYMFRKPNKRIFELALEKAGLQPEDVWYIGDNYLCDVVGARSAGIFPVWYIGATADPQGEDDVMRISHWDELQKQIEELTNKEARV